MDEGLREAPRHVPLLRTRAQLLRGRAEVVVFSRDNHMVFQPLLPDVAGSSLNPRAVAPPLRQLLPGAMCRLALPQSRRLQANYVLYWAILSDACRRGLAAFADRSFDYVILSETLQAIHRQEPLLKEMLRVGREAIVSFPNFGYWRARIQIAFSGRMPVSRELPYQWYDTPNVHHCTLVDFEELCAKLGFRVLERVVLKNGGTVSFLPNLLGANALYRVSA